MRNFKLEIEQAKKEIIESKKREWAKAGKHKYGEEFIEPKITWFITQWDTGFIVVDYEELRKLPKIKRNKILSLAK